MPQPKNPGLAISIGAHAFLLAAALISFSHKPAFDDAQESIPVEMVSDQEFNQIMKGEKTAPRRAKPAQRVERFSEILEPKPRPATADAKTDSPAPPPKEKSEQETARPEKSREEPKPAPTPPERTASITPPPKPASQPPAATVKAPTDDSAEAIEPKPNLKPRIEPKAVETKPAEPKPVEKPQKAEPKFKPDQLAKLLDEEKQKDLAHKPPPNPAPKPKSAQENPEPKFDLGDIGRLLNKDAPQRKASQGRELQQEASLGSPTASAAKMSPSLWGQLDGMLQEQYKGCWNYVGLGGQQKYVPEIHVQYAQDGSLIGQPALLNPPTDPNLRTLAESALRAVRRCNPLHIPAQFQPYYDQWKGRIVRFDPEEML